MSIYELVPWPITPLSRPGRRFSRISGMNLLFSIILHPKKKKKKEQASKNHSRFVLLSGITPDIQAYNAAYNP
jgi:hypothetical protein